MPNEQSSDELSEQFSKWLDKLVFVQTRTGKKYEGITLKSIDRSASPIRFLNFEKSWDKKMLCFVAEEIVRIEEMKCK